MQSIPAEKEALKPQMVNKVLIKKFAVLIRAKECCSNSREGFTLQKLQAFLKGIIDVNLAITTNNRNPSSTAYPLVWVPRPRCTCFK
jgi:hypothetical protein